MKPPRFIKRNEFTQRLRDAGVEFVSHNMGEHLVIEIGSKVVDYWPSTGKWQLRGVEQSFGFNALMLLINHLRKQHATGIQGGEHGPG